MTSKTFIRISFLIAALAVSVALLSTSRGKPAPTATGEDGIQCREKGDNCRAKSDNAEILESISRHLLGNQ